ncbi:MAG: haloalkane dehalogenase, partial [Acidimicrobiia bacterium]
SGPERYRFTEHREFLDGLLLALGVIEDVTLVAHDWGTALAFDWARRHPDSVRGIAYMEGIVMPLSWEDWPDAARPIFQAMRSPAGDDLVLERNVFVERILPKSVLRGLGEEEMAVYRRPYEQPGESRRPTLAWPRQLPMDGEPADVCAIVDSYSRFLAESQIPKLFVNGDPGSILVGAARDRCRSFPSQREVTVRGIHFLQEDSPDEIGRAVATWLTDLR